MVAGSAVSGLCAELVASCDRAALAKAPPMRVSIREARNKLRNKIDIAVDSAVLAKLPDDGLTLDVVVSNMGGIECFILYSEKRAVSLAASDKDDLRVAIDTALHDWQFEPYVLNDSRVRMMARLPLRIEHHELVLAPAFEIPKLRD